jgi:hypothetical protein
MSSAFSAPVFISDGTNIQGLTKEEMEIIMDGIREIKDLIETMPSQSTADVNILLNKLSRLDY